MQSALSGIDIALWDLKAKKLNIPIYELLGGRVRDKVRVYSWIGGDNPEDVEAQARARKQQGFTAVKMNATGSINMLDSPKALDGAVERLKAVTALDMDAGLGRSKLQSFSTMSDRLHTFMGGYESQWPNSSPISWSPIGLYLSKNPY